MDVGIGIGIAVGIRESGFGVGDPGLLINRKSKIINHQSEIFLKMRLVLLSHHP